MARLRAYDYRNRRARRQTLTYASSGGTWSVATTTVYVWDGWRVLMELTGANNGVGAIGESPALTIARKYAWGLDLAGQWAGGLGTAGARAALEAARGIGGLLAVHDAAATADYAFCYDGNGNVVQLVNWLPTTWNAGTVMVATYQYDPYGNVIGTPGGAYAATNRWRFSTKIFDPETSFGYWGYRWYAPALGRWVNRDPIGEAGGANTYAYVVNRPNETIDPSGHVKIPILFPSTTVYVCLCVYTVANVPITVPASGVCETYNVGGLQAAAGACCTSQCKPGILPGTYGLAVAGCLINQGYCCVGL